MRARTLVGPALFTMLGCPSADAGSSVATATDSSSETNASSTSTSTSGSTREPEPEPETGSACGEPLEGGWGDCINGNAQACGNEDASCLANSTMNPAWGSCILPCVDVCDCWAAPEAGAAQPACAPVLAAAARACVLDCSAGERCPEGMRCVALTGVQSLCAYDSDSFDPTTGGDSSGGETTTGSSSSGGSSSDGSSSSGSSSSSSTGS